MMSSPAGASTKRWGFIGLALAVVLMAVVGGIILLLGGRRRQGEFV